MPKDSKEVSYRHSRGPVSQITRGADFSEIADIAPVFQTEIVPTGTSKTKLRPFITMTKKNERSNYLFLTQFLGGDVSRTGTVCLKQMVASVFFFVNRINGRSLAFEVPVGTVPV